MSDEIRETPPEPEARNRKQYVAALLIVLLVLLLGVGVGLAVGGGGDDDAPAPGPAGNPATTPGAPAGSTQPTRTPPGARPTTPAPAGSTLTTVTTPPEGTLAMIDASRLGANAEYTITFGCFGYGPPQGGQTLVIQIAEAAPENESAEALDMNGQNLLARLAPGVAPVKVGGTYRGTLFFQAQGDLLVPVLKNVTSVGW